ncbi:MAG: BON domain-containing protein [Deltaproteobacteria bacterium]|nr:BON domain-containing protein [Deltaproteobacteria bacterium]
MKKRNVFTTYLVLVLAFATLTACWSGAAQRSIGRYGDDSAITAEVKVRLAANDLVKSLQVGVETSHGVVQLSGFVDSQNSADQAGSIARSVEGVTSVRNDLVVQ